MNEFLYERDGDLFVPSLHTGSPWSTSTQHGGPVNALMMRAAEAFAVGEGKRVARLSVDILRPVPREPARLTTQSLRTGRRMSVADITLAGGDGTLLATARAITLKARDDLPILFPDERPSIGGYEQVPVADLISDDRRRDGPPGFHLSIELRHAAAATGSVCWFTWPMDLVKGEAVSPGQRCAAICDLATIASGRLRLSAPGTWDSTQRFEMLNTDTTVQFLRAPQGDWFALTDTVITDQDGIGMTQASLHDEAGRLGHVVQTVASNAP